MIAEPLSWIDLGGLRVALLRGGALRLDGGAMFGIIPKALWARACPADEQNRISLACNCVLVEWSGAAGRRAIIEVGHGPKYAAKEQGIFAIDPTDWLLPALRRADIGEDTISDVILSHLHFDHAGGLTRPAEPEQPWTPDAPLVATFPKARVHVQKREFDDARTNFGIMTITYREENFRPIDALGAWRLLDGDEEIVPQVAALRTPGHTRGHHSIFLRGSERTAVFVGDVMPTRHHAGAPYNMAYDLLPIDNRASKAGLLRRAADENYLLILDHDPQQPLARVETDGSHLRVVPAR